MGFVVLVIVLSLLTSEVLEKWFSRKGYSTVKSLIYGGLSGFGISALAIMWEFSVSCAGNNCGEVDTWKATILILVVTIGVALKSTFPFLR